MVIFSTNKKNTEKTGKNCLHEDDVGKKTFAETYMFKKNVCRWKFLVHLYPQSFFKLQSQSNKNMLTRPGEEQLEC